MDPIVDIQIFPNHHYEMFFDYAQVHHIRLNWEEEFYPSIRKSRPLRTNPCKYQTTKKACSPGIGIEQLFFTQKPSRYLCFHVKYWKKTFKLDNIIIQPEYPKPDSQDVPDSTTVRT